jgi:hypothetical protein
MTRGARLSAAVSRRAEPGLAAVGGAVRTRARGIKCANDRAASDRHCLASPLALRPDRRPPPDSCSSAHLASRTAVPTASHPDRRCPKPPSPGSNRATDADVHVVVPPDAAVYVVVPHRRPHAGEPRHVFPGRLPCAGEGATVRQPCRASAAHCAEVRVTRCAGRPRPSWATPAWPWAALTGHASAVNTGRARMALGRTHAVQLGRARFRPSDTRISFSIL